MKMYWKIFSCLVLFLVSCEERRSEETKALEVLTEVKRIGVGSFKNKIHAPFSKDSHQYVVFRDIPNLADGMKDALMGCLIIGDSSNPNGILFQSYEGDDYYVSVDGSGVPRFFGGYQHRKVIDGVWIIYR